MKEYQIQKDDPLLFSNDPDPATFQGVRGKGGIFVLTGKGIKIRNHNEIKAVSIDGAYVYGVHAQIKDGKLIINY